VRQLEESRQQHINVRGWELGRVVSPLLESTTPWFVALLFFVVEVLFSVVVYVASFLVWCRLIISAGSTNI